MPNAAAASLALVENIPAPKDGEHCSGCDESFLAEQSYECNGFVVNDPTAIVERWHNDTHPGGFRFCDQQPCHAINWAVGR
jgi:hypothetical protein